MMGKLLVEAFDQFGNSLGYYEVKAKPEDWRGWFGSNEMTTFDPSDLPKGVVMPTVNVTQATDIVDGQIYTIRDVIRYNPPPVGRFCAHATRNSDGNKALVNTWRDSLLAWKCEYYNRTHYRDKDGVDKGL